jgi:hypothetical protein
MAGGLTIIPFLFKLGVEASENNILVKAGIYCARIIGGKPLLGIFVLAGSQRYQSFSSLSELHYSVFQV